MNRLHPATMIVAFLPKLYDAFRQVLPFLAISFFQGGSDRMELFIAAIGVLGGFGAIAAYITTRYGFEEGSLVCKSGWLFKRDRRIPLDQIQNVNVRQGMLERLLKVVTLEVETAAGSGSELKLQVITEGDAEVLRKELVSIAPARTESQASELADGHIVYKMDRQDLILGAMAENQGGQIVFAVLGTVGAAALSQVLYAFFQFKDLIPSWLSWIGGLFVVGCVWMFGWIYGGMQYATKFAYFTVKSEPGLFRISHGLITKFQYTVRIKRVELASVTSTLWQRVAKCVTVRVGTAGSFGEQGTMAPIAMMLPEGKALETIQRVLPDFAPEQLEWKRYPRYYLFIKSFRTGVAMIVIAAIMLVIDRTFVEATMPDVHWLIPVIMCIILLWMIVHLVVAYKKSNYGIGDKYIAVRAGLFLKTHTYMPIHRIDTIGTSEPSWWRRRGVTALTANAMVQSLMIEMIPFADAQRIIDSVVARPDRPGGFTLNLAQGLEPDPI